MKRSLLIVIVLFAVSAGAGEVSPQHQWLKKHIAGSWSIRNVVYPEHGDSLTTSGTSEVKAAYGDRFLIEEFSVARKGGPMRGTIWWGYDDLRKKFTSAEIDSAGTGLTAVSGLFDAPTNTLTLSGTVWSAPLNRETPLRLVVHIDGDDKHTIEIYGADASGGEVKRQEVVYTRK
jgi:hypothetical protein